MKAINNTMKQIINSLLDNDLYTFSVCYAYLRKFPRALGQYTFVDRNNTVYPKGFAEKLQEQFLALENLRIDDDDIEFMTRKCYYFPKWFFTFLKGFSLQPSEVETTQDEEGHLHISVTGLLWRTVFWEMPILATISELMHELMGEFEHYDAEKEYQKSYDKATRLISNGVNFSDFGTRRRFSFNHQDMVIRSFVEAQKQFTKTYFVGTSNVLMAKKYGLTPIGTMSHQFIETCSLYGYTEANYLAMDYWQEVYAGSLGIFLYDTYTRKAFFQNFTQLHAKLFDGLRVDSGDNIEALEEIIEKYKELGIDPAQKSIIFSNGLNVDDAISIHHAVNGRMLDSFGIGTHLTCDIDNVAPMNIVVKLTAAKITEKRNWKKVVKLSDDLGKYTGDPEEIEICRKTLQIS